MDLDTVAVDGAGLPYPGNSVLLASSLGKTQSEEYSYQYPHEQGDCDEGCPGHCHGHEEYLRRDRLRVLEYYYEYCCYKYQCEYRFHLVHCVPRSHQFSVQCTDRFPVPPDLQAFRSVEDNGSRILHDQGPAAGFPGSLVHFVHVRFRLVLARGVGTAAVIVGIFLLRLRTNKLMD